MPFLLFLLGVATLVAVGTKSKAPIARTQTFTLDANMPADLRNQVIAALVSGSDPATLDAFATAVQAQYPLSAGLLHAKAISLRALPGRPPAPALPASDQDGPPLDPSMPPAMVTFVHGELVNETDPARLRALSSTMAGSYPVASGLLAQRAAALAPAPAKSAAPTTSAPVPSQSAAPPPSASAPNQKAEATPAPAVNVPGFDPGMPPDVAEAIVAELASDTDPEQLQEAAQQIQGRYPMAANLLATKASTLLALGQSLAPPAATVAARVTTAPVPAPVVSAPHAVAPQPAPAPAAAPAPSAAPSGVSGSMVGLDANMQQDAVQRVLADLAGEGDPVKLEAHADELAPRYPIAAGLLRTRANAILAARPQTSRVPSAAPALAAPPAPTPAPSPSQDATSGTYVVQANDNPWKIATQFTGHGERWPELVAANPKKARGKDGNFTTLLPGEKLTLPASWVASSSSTLAANPPKSAAPAGAPSVASPAATPSASAPPAAPPANSLDPGIPENVASAVLAALKTGTDSTQLRGFASAVAEHGFPVAAAVLTAKANTLGPAPAPAPTASVSPAASAAPVVSPSPAPSASSTPASTPSAASSASSTPASAASPATSASPAHASAPAPPPGQQAPSTYKVKSGDSPWKITAALIHDGNRWPELVAANPQKKKGKDGNFTSLLPGEVLQLPASWAPSSATTQPTTSPQGGA